MCNIYIYIYMNSTKLFVLNHSLFLNGSDMKKKSILVVSMDKNKQHIPRIMHKICYV